MINKALLDMVHYKVLGGFLIDININLHNYIFSINIKTHNKTSYMFII